ncbi:MAG: hypothetical protein NVSMB57_00980 [Actinomycetota bacterium]
MNRRAGTCVPGITFALTLAVVACGSRVPPPRANAAGPASSAPDILQTIPGSGSNGSASLSAASPSSLRGVSGGSQGAISYGDPSCRGGATDVGVYADHVDLGLVAAKTGPLPGQFNATIEAVDAYFKMLNAEHGGICGRKIVLNVRDDAGSASLDERYARELAEEKKVFAFVGSISAPDSDTGVAKVAREHRIVDIGCPLTFSRSASAYSYGGPGQLQPRLIGEGANAIPYLNRKFGIKQIAMVWLGEALVSKVNAWAFEAAALKASNEGITICYAREIATLDNNFQSYAIAMKGSCPASKGPLAVYSTVDNSSNIKLAQAMADQGVPYKVFSPTFSSYLQSFVKDENGRPRAATEGAYISLPQVPFERCARLDDQDRPVPPCSHPELDRYVRALRRYVPGFRAPGSFGAPGWGMAELFTQAAVRCGAALTRECLRSSLDAMGSFTDRGLLAPARPSAHVIYSADLLLRVHNGGFVEEAPQAAHGPPEAPDLWDSYALFDWWNYYCGHKKSFGKSATDVDSFVTTC